MPNHLVHHLPSLSLHPSLDAPELPSGAHLAASLIDTDGLEQSVELLSRLLPDVIARELCASPYALRAGLLGLKQGRAFTFHERRLRMPLAEHLAPEVPVWAHGEQMTVWQEGVLQEPKYYSFFVDAPLPVFNPNYRGKWRSHELLHGAVGFCWNPEFTRFDAYLAARLAELLPVVHWYGWDEAWRQRCEMHMHIATPPLRECAACEASARDTPFWSARQRQGDLEHAIASMDRAVTHFSQEWSACMRELHTRRAHETLYKNLNASRDAIGYVHGHWPRQSAWSFGAWVELFMRRDTDYVEDMTQYASRVLARTHELLYGELTIEVDEVRHAQRRRAVQDLGYRALYLFEYVDEGSPSERQMRDVLLPRVEALAAAVDDVLVLDEALEGLVEGFGAIAPLFPDGFLELVTAVGHDLLPVDLPGAAWERSQVVEGVLDGAQTLALAIEGAEVDPGDVFEGFVYSAEFARAGTLLERAASWLESRGEADFAELTALEAMMLGMPRRDDAASAFAMTFEDIEEVLASASNLRAHATLTRGVFRAVILEAVFEQSYAEELDTPCPVWRVVAPDGTLHLDLCDEAQGEILDEVCSGSEPGAWQVERWDRGALIALLDAGVLWWSGAK